MYREIYKQKHTHTYIHTLLLIKFWFLVGGFVLFVATANKYF